MTAAPAKRPPGRPKGLPRTGGRAKGTPNKATSLSRDYIVRRGAPIAFLCSVVRGTAIEAAPEPGARKREKVVPTLDQRIAAAKVLAAKVLPDMKAIEHSGDPAQPMAVRINLGVPA